MAIISQMQSKSIKEAMIDQSLIDAMKEELLQFEKNEVWTLVPDPLDQTIIGTRWVFRNKLDEEVKIVRNKARLNIIFEVGSCARFQFSPKESHLTTVKRIFRYLVGTTDLGLWYSKSSHFDFVADYVGDKIERKNTSGECQFLEETLISWSCRKKNMIVISTTEAEYISAANCCS
ncbi:secreted RxLR effector protein 161-like [Cicer arietinum]|uniref:secreted RxLR effector protein 161-like n=1 Tax=Cicer arietinum TaxID=3827 RepID=UPI003CC542B1